MTTPPPMCAQALAGSPYRCKRPAGHDGPHAIDGVTEAEAQDYTEQKRTNHVMGALVPQSPAAALLSHAICRAAEDLWDAAVAETSYEMYAEVRVIASRLLALCPAD